jgi:hypothetical protein
MSIRGEEYLLIAQMHDLVYSDRRLTIHEIAEGVEISHGSCQAPVTKDLDMRCASGKFVPQLLTQELEDECLSVASDLLECAETDKNNGNPGPCHH